MNATISDIVVHIDESLAPEALADLERGLRRDQGVVSVAHHANRNHLVVVAYDSTVTRAFEVLRHVRRSGVHAQLIGM